DRLECWRQLHNAHPEGWRERPCEAPATTVTSGLLAGLRPAAPMSAVPFQGTIPGTRHRAALSGAPSRQVPTPARRPTAAGTDEGERPRPCEYASHHEPVPVRLRQPPLLPRVRR